MTHDSAIPQSTRRSGLSWAMLVTALVLLVAAGLGHRALLQRIGVAMSQTAELKQPLESTPLDLGPWRGREIPFDPESLNVGWFDDEFLNRGYVHEETETSVGVFVGYVGRPRSTFGHRPDVCYAANGWTEEDQRSIVFTTDDGRVVHAILYRFDRARNFGPPLLVLATYVINGRFLEDPSDLTRWHSRGAGLLGERASYLTRVQLSTLATRGVTAETAALRDLMGRLVEPLAACMPYWESDDSDA